MLATASAQVCVPLGHSSLYLIVCNVVVVASWLYHMSADSRWERGEHLEDGDLGLGNGCQPGGLPPFKILRRPRSSNRQRPPPESSAFQDSDAAETDKGSTSPLTRLTSKLGFSSKSKYVPPVDDDVPDKLKSDTVELGTSLRQQKLVFNRDMMTILHRQSVDLQQFETLGVLYIANIIFSCVLLIILHSSVFF